MTEHVVPRAREPQYSFEKKKYQVTSQEICALLGIAVPLGAKVSVSGSPAGNVVIEVTKESGDKIALGDAPFDAHIPCRSGK